LYEVPLFDVIAQIIPEEIYFLFICHAKWSVNLNFS